MDELIKEITDFYPRQSQSPIEAVISNSVLRFVRFYRGIGLLQGQTALCIGVLQRGLFEIALEIAYIVLNIESTSERDDYVKNYWSVFWTEYIKLKISRLAVLMIGHSYESQSQDEKQSIEEEIEKTLNAIRSCLAQSVELLKPKTIATVNQLLDSGSILTVDKINEYLADFKSFDLRSPKPDKYDKWRQLYPKLMDLRLSDDYRKALFLFSEASYNWYFQQSMLIGNSSVHSMSSLITDWSDIISDPNLPKIDSREDEGTDHTAPLIRGPVILVKISLEQFFSSPIVAQTVQPVVSSGLPDRQTSHA